MRQTRAEYNEKSKKKAAERILRAAVADRYFLERELAKALMPIEPHQIAVHNESIGFIKLCLQDDITAYQSFIEQCARTLVQEMKIVGVRHGSKDS